MPDTLTSEDAAREPRTRLKIVTMIDDPTDEQVIAELRKVVPKVWKTPFDLWPGTIVRVKIGKMSAAAVATGRYVLLAVVIPTARTDGTGRVRMFDDFGELVDLSVTMDDIEVVQTTDQPSRPLDQDVIELVIAGRKVLDETGIETTATQRLDRALEQFATRVRWDDEPDEDDDQTDAL